MFCINISFFPPCSFYIRKFCVYLLLGKHQNVHIIFINRRISRTDRPFVYIPFSLFMWKHKKNINKFFFNNFYNLYNSSNKNSSCYACNIKTYLIFTTNKNVLIGLILIIFLVWFQKKRRKSIKTIWPIS